jgi:NAD(P)-dependent dehydrogenase (short-subunit alcohol dehydrogenase family)
VIGLTKALAVDWGQYNIANCVCPGLTFTELSKFVASKNEMMKQREMRIPLQRGAPEDIAHAVLPTRQANAISGGR